MTGVPSRLTLAQRGFTLTELVLVLVIVGLLLGGMLIPLATQSELRAYSDTQKTLAEVKEALLGFTAARGRLPCPASSTSAGMEAPAGGGACSNPHDGFVPAAALGIATTDPQGYALDAWNQRLRYAVTTANGNAFTSANGMRNATLATLAPDLRICSTSVGATGTGSAAAECAASGALTTGAVAVIYSLGKNGISGGTGADEGQNPNPNAGVAADRLFVHHERSPPDAPQGEFDDALLWLSAPVLYNRLVAAGQLP